MGPIRDKKLAEYDLAVIGAGPAGSAAAITAARLGAKVALIERGTFPRQKVCGEFVSAESLDLLSELLSESKQHLLHDAIRISRARIHLDGQDIRTEITPPAASIARLDLDAALWQSAQEAGVRVYSKCTVQSISGEVPFKVSGAAETFHASSVINATGRWSNLNSGDAEYSGDKWIGLKAHYEEPQAEPVVALYFFNGGYCGVQPVDLLGTPQSRRVNVAAMVNSNVATTLPKIFTLHPALLKRSSAWRELGKAVATSPLVFRQPECVSGNILRVGDAAGFVDPFVGDGISLALRSGSLAARSLNLFFNRRATLSDVIARYRHEYNLTLAPVFANSSQLRRLLNIPRSLRAPLLFVVNRTPRIARWVVRKTR